MRRMLAFLMAAVLLVTATGCGSKTVPTTEPEQPTVTEPAEPTPAEPAVTAPTEAEIAAVEAAYDTFTAETDFAGSYGMNRLYRLDLNADGLNELVVYTATCEADAMLEVYTVTSGTVTKAGELPGAHAALYEDTVNGGLLTAYGHMGVEHVELVRLADGALTTENVVAEHETQTYTVLTGWKRLEGESAPMSETELRDALYKDFLLQTAFRGEASYVRFFRFDLDGDGLDELMVRTGTCEADSLLDFYTVKDGEVQAVGEESGSHLVLFGNTRDGGAILQYGHQGYEDVIAVKLADGKLASETLVSARQVGAEGYTREAHWTQLEGHSPLTFSYSRQKMMLAEQPDAYKSIGRTYYTEMKCTGLVCAWPASGLEFTVACEGDIQMTYTALENGYFAVEVDGVMQPDRIRTKTLNDKTVTVVTGLPAGEHTIRIVKDSDISTNGAFTVLTSVEYFGDPATFRATPDKQYYIEFIGDSITAGKGSLASGLYESDDPCHSATASYAYQFSRMLGADYSIVARGGIGVMRRTESLPLVMQEVYPYVNGFAKNPVEYDFERKPDLVILALGTNDPSAGGSDDFHKAMAEMITEIRTCYGEEVPILLLYNMMTGSFGADFPPIGEDNHCFSYRVTRNNDGAHSGNSNTGHPSAAGHLVVAQELMEAWPALWQ